MTTFSMDWKINKNVEILIQKALAPAPKPRVLERK
jgi:hypothetical protein